MSIFLLVAISFAVIAEAVKVPHTAALVGNTKNVRKNNLTGSGVVQISVARRLNSNVSRKRQSIDPLRNDISGYSVQSKYFNSYCSTTNSS
jgi:hypothetical protein